MKIRIFTEEKKYRLLTTEEDNDLIVQIKNGDKLAFERLFKKYHRYLVAIALSYTGSKMESRDLSQEVFLDLWKRRKKIIITSSVRSFLRQAVINLSLNSIKRRKRKNSLSKELYRTISEDQTSEIIEYNELKKTIDALIEELPQRCKAVFKLSRNQGKSHKEIAAILGISTKTIENQMTKALKHLRTGLKKADFISLIMFVSTIICLWK